VQVAARVELEESTSPSSWKFIIQSISFAAGTLAAAAA